ncbi:uncharacterized mitochondrial protein AtMg00810-like [Hevea brasiliensis]|uniref:uncharacterized mitochondrial protein AtMg00810-like n=1 Tax=Hevea brasiliensis TaxID=3981 RepID=UPI0025F23FA7|nr:uncharacterized mitochondrial protein AtMg00810-like [Hevea brasiliensis]
MLGCKLAESPIEANHKLQAGVGESVDIGRYQRLVGRLIYLSHTRPDIAYAVGLVSQYMHDPREPHLKAIFRILRYLKSAPGKGLLFSNMAIFRLRPLQMQNEVDLLMIEDRYLVIVLLLVVI